MQIKYLDQKWPNNIMKITTEMAPKFVVSLSK
jgi:hypothetical protein